MLNVNQITSTLAKLPDQQLQQYAAMHKNDPYIVSLAVAESNRRKAMREGAQAQGPQGPQPKVVDEDIAAMHAPMPEDQGIARLPAGDMNFADGGIVAFGGGGDVPRFQTGGTPSRYPGLMQYGTPDGRVAGGTLLPATTGLEGKSLGELWDWFIDTLPTEEKEMAKQRKAREEDAMEPLYKGYRARSSMGEGERAVAMENAGLSPTPPTPAEIAAANAATPPGAQPGAAAPGARVPMNAGLASPNLGRLFQNANKLAAENNDPRADAIGRQVESMGRAGVDLAARNTRLTQERIDQFKDAYQGREDRLAEREAQIGRDKEENKGLALLQTGMALMSTPGAFGQAFGKAAGIGTEKYAAGLEKLKASQERLMDARDRLDDLKLNRAETSAKELQAAKLDEDRARIGAQKQQVDFAVQRLGWDKKDAEMFFKGEVEMAKTRMEQTGMNARANASSAQERIALALGNGNLEAGLRKAAEISAGKFDVRKAYTEYLVAAQKGMGDVMPFADFAAQFRLTTTAPPAGAAVRER